MRAIAILAALAAFGAPFAAADDGKPAEKREAIKAKPEADRPAHTGVRQQQGRVLTDNDWNSARTKKLKGVRKYPDLTLKRGVISREAALRRRSALAPLKRRVGTAGMSPGEAAYVKALQDWAVAQDKRLLELQKLHTEYDRLRAYRDAAAAKGEDTSRIDPRLAAMEGKMKLLGDDAQQANIDLQKKLQMMQMQVQRMSKTTQRMHDTAKNIIQNMKA